MDSIKNFKKMAKKSKIKNNINKNFYYTKSNKKIFN